MTRLLAILALLLSPAALAQLPAQSPAQSPAPQSPPISEANPSATISVRSSLVVVPALVKTKSGQLVFTLKADDFIVKDDGIPQKLQLEEDTDSQPLALVVVVEVGGDGIRYLDEYSDLGPLLDAIVGNVPHRVAIVDFDSDPELLHGFTSDLGKIVTELNHIESGDNGASVLDAMSFAVKLLREQPPTYRRAILLLSETLDQGSHIDLTEALHELSDTNTSIYALSFASTKTQIKDEAHRLNRPDEPGPEHGCFSRDPNAPPHTTESRGQQDFDCLADLLPPLRLARMVEIAMRNSLRKNVPETCARLSGGEYFSFKDPKSLRRDLFTISNDVPNRYVLTFRPQSPHPGLHALTVELKNRPEFRLDARTEYWVDESPNPSPDTSPATPPSK
jgi:VWFA-related protein